MQYVPRADMTWGEVKAERAVDDVLTQSQMAAAPPKRPGVLLPPRFGYRPYQARQIRIEDVIDVPRIYNDPRVTFTGTPAGYSGSSRPSMEGA